MSQLVDKPCRCLGWHMVHEGAKWYVPMWQNFVSPLRDAYTPINIAGDAQARLRTHQVVSSVDFTEITILMCSTRP